jgi:hypothetical protein
MSDPVKSVWMQLCAQEENMPQSLTDGQLIVDAVSKYAWGYDQNDMALLAEAFSVGAISGGKISGTDFSWGPMVGKEAIVSGLGGMRATATIQPRHCVTNILFLAQTDTTARLQAYLTLMATENGATRVATCGTLDIDAVKEGDEWRVSRLDVTLDAPF